MHVGIKENVNNMYVRLPWSLPKTYVRSVSCMEIDGRIRASTAVYMFVHMGERGRRCSAVYIETHRRTRAAVLRDVYIHAYEYKWCIYTCRRGGRCADDDDVRRAGVLTTTTTTWGGPGRCRCVMLWSYVPCDQPCSHSSYEKILC